MQLEEMEHRWQRLEEKLDRSLRLDRELLRRTVLDATRRRLNWMAWWPVVEIGCCLLVLVPVGSFLARHWDSSVMVGPGGCLMICAIAYLASCVRQLTLLSGIAWDGGLVEIQEALAKLHLVRVAQLKWVVLLSPLIWICAVLVVGQALLDRLPERHSVIGVFNPWWVGANVALGLLFVPFGHAVLGWMAARFGSRGWWKRAADASSGTTLRMARQELEQWARVES